MSSLGRLVQLSTFSLLNLREKRLMSELVSATFFSRSARRSYFESNFLAVSRGDYMRRVLVEVRTD